MKFSVAALNEQRGAAIDRMVELRDLWTKEERVPTAEERSEFTELESKVESLDTDIAFAKRAASLPEAKLEVRDAVPSVSPTPVAQVSVTSEPLTYSRENRSVSFLRDVISAKKNVPDVAAVERLQRHMEEVGVEQRAQTTSDGSGGELVPPIWVIDDYEAVAREGRSWADQWTRNPLYPYGDVISIPALATGSTAAVQTEGSAISNTDVSTTSINAAVITVAGEQTFNRQVLDRGVPGVDQMYFNDLLAAYNEQVDTALITRNATNSKGVLNLSGSGSVTYTASTPTGPALYVKITEALGNVATNLKSDADVILMHPRRWYWMLGQTDTTGRPLVVPIEQGPANTVAALKSTVNGVVGTMAGRLVVTSAHVPTNLGSGTNEDRIVVAKRSALALMEQPAPNFKLDEFSSSSSLQVKMSLFGYIAFAVRNTKAVAAISGTGLAG